MPSPTDTHPSELELERALFEGEPREVLTHAQGCEQCGPTLRLLEGLAAELALPAVAVPGARDAAILAGRPKRSRRWWAAAVPAAAVAAGLVVGLQIIVPSADQSAPVSRHDLNHDGRVDILDAMALSQAVAERESGPRFDITGEGRVDHSDVRALAAIAVALEPTP